MSPGGMARYDVRTPEDAQVLVNNGVAWRGGPKTIQTIIRLIMAGSVKRNPSKETPEVTAYLDKVAPVSPVEPPVADDEGLPLA